MLLSSFLFIVCMCGIAGIITTRPTNGNVLQATLQRMTDAIAHRGPDGEGFWMAANGQVALGHRRLKIIDLSNHAAQPMHYGSCTSIPEGQKTTPRYTITYNGELYNYLELKNTLKASGYAFTTHSDTEVLLAAYDYWKKDCLQHFDGMFAFAIWDAQEQELFCARDRFGEKPLYFFYDETQFAFASEMKALWAAGAPKVPNTTQLLNYITIGMVQNTSKPDSSFYDGIYSLPPANYLTVQLPTLQVAVVQYWDLDKETCNHTITPNEALEQFSFLLQQSVSRRLRSDVAVGTSLSGGLDSSAIVATISKLLPESSQISSFSAVFPGFEKDETRYIQEVTKQFSINNFTVTPTANDLLKDFDTLLYHQEEPFQSLSIYAQYKVYELAKQHGTTVILDGQGADETLAGYHKYYHWYWQELFANGHWRLTKNEIQAAKSRGIQTAWGLKNTLAAFLPQMATKALEQKVAGMQKNNPFIHTDFLAAGQNTPSYKKPVVTKLNDILYYNTCQQGLQELLRYADRNSMAHGREVRLPFLSHELVQFIFSLPSHFKIKDGFTKFILRKSMANILPPSITWRTDKIGYEPPQQQWLQHTTIQERIMDSRQKLVNQHILKPTVMQQPINAMAAHEADNSDFRYLCVATML